MAEDHRAQSRAIWEEGDAGTHIIQHNLLWYKMILDPNRTKMSTFAQGTVTSLLQGKLLVEVNPSSGISSESAACCA